jgi:hypothetical protein
MKDSLLLFLAEKNSKTLLNVNHKLKLKCTFLRFG